MTPSRLQSVSIALSAYLALLALAAPEAAWAYVGPGAGLTAIGTGLALLGAVIFAIIGFVWYPMKRMMKRKRATAPEAASASETGRS